MVVQCHLGGLGAEHLLEPLLCPQPKIRGRGYEPIPKRALMNRRTDDTLIYARNLTDELLQTRMCGFLMQMHAHLDTSGMNTVDRSFSPRVYFNR